MVESKSYDFSEVSLLPSFKLDLFHNYKHFFVVAVEWSSLLEWIILLQYIVKNSAADLLISSLEQKIKSAQRIFLSFERTK